MEQAASTACKPPSQVVSGPLSPRGGEALGPTKKHRRALRGIQWENLAEVEGKVKAVSCEPADTSYQADSRSLHRNYATEYETKKGGLYTLTGQLLGNCYAFVGFHTFLLQFCPELLFRLRHASSFGHPLMLLPRQGAVWGWFFSYINGSIQQFVMRGVLGCLIFICLLHLVRVVLRPIASSQGRHPVFETSGSAASIKNLGFFTRLTRTASSAHWRLYKRRERFCARLIAVVCLALTLIQTTSFFFGGWTLKAIGFPDIYLGALTKPGGLWGHETATDVVMQHPDVVQIFPGDLRRSLTELEPHTNSPLLVLVLVLGFALDAWGQYLQAKAIRRYLSKKILLCGAGLFASVMIFASFNLQGVPSCNSKDGHWVDFGVQRELGHMKDASGAYMAANPPLMYSEYLPMRDGVRLAADIYLPHSFEDSARSWALLQHRQHVLRQVAANAKKRLESVSDSQDNTGAERLNTLLQCVEQIGARLKESEENLREQVEKIPVYLEITRYNRRSEHFWPFTLLSIWRHPRGSSLNMWSWQTQQLLVANQYAVVVVDTRGSGASFGARPVDLSPEELNDSAELVKWTKEQWFSNGRVAGGGLSYDGMVGLSMAARGGVDAVVSLFTPMDVMGELVAPGGVLCHSFLSDYAGLTNGFEHHGTPWRHMLSNPLQFPLHVLLGFLFSFGGTSAVLGHEAELPNAMRSHRLNWKMTDAVSGVRFYDDKVRFTEKLEATATSLGITEEIMTKLAQKKVSVLMVSGFCDSSTARGAIRLYSYMQAHAPESRPQLILGNWSHGGRRTCDPYGGSFSCFEVDLYATVLRFFDCHLKNKCWGGIQEEPPVHYWQTGDSQWRTAQRFPPEAGMSNTEVQLSSQSVRDASLHGEGFHGANAAGRTWLPRLFDSPSSSLEHTLHDFTQRVQLYLNMMELHENAHISAEPGSGRWQEGELKGILGRGIKRSWLSRLLSALIGAMSSYRQGNANNDLQGIFSHDENAYFMQLPGSGQGTETAQAPHLEYTVEYLSSTGEYSRWPIAQHPFRISVNYGNRLLQKPKRPGFPITLSPDPKRAQPFSLSPYAIDHLHARPLSFVTEPLSMPLTMVGSAFLHLSIAVKDCNEVSMFAYIEDLDVASGYSHYVTEGQIMASHRPSKPVEDIPIGAYGRFKRTFFRKDHKPVNEGGEDVVVSLSFEPNAWTFQEGHAIRLVLTGSDVENFSFLPNSEVVLPRKWKVLTSSAYLSLPVLDHQEN